MPKTMTLDYARRKIAKLTVQRNYWRRRVLNPNYERDRIAKWRREKRTMKTSGISSSNVEGNNVTDVKQ